MVLIAAQNINTDIIHARLIQNVFIDLIFFIKTGNCLTILICVCTENVAFRPTRQIASKKIRRFTDLLSVRFSLHTH